MKIKLILISMAAICSLNVKAQSNLPNYLLAGQLNAIIGKIGLPVDSAADCLKGYFTKVEKSGASETVYKLDTDEVYISLEKNPNGETTLIKVFMPKTMLSTAEKAINFMGMVKTNTAAPPGYTAYATPKYAAFLNPELPNGVLSLVMVRGGK